MYRHPPPATTEHDLPVYANRLFDLSVTRPDALRQGPTTTNRYGTDLRDGNIKRDQDCHALSFFFLSPCRSQSDTSQSFSAELDAVYRLYCREYELQLQLQQQQLELQKQQLQLQQQLQQLEFFHQRQQQQQPASFTEKMVRNLGFFYLNFFRARLKLHGKKTMCNRGFSLRVKYIRHA